MPLAKTEKEWGERAARFLKGELKKADMTYDDLAKKLKRHGLTETKISIASKLSRGTFAATFFLACLRHRLHRKVRCSRTLFVQIETRVRPLHRFAVPLPHTPLRSVWGRNKRRRHLFLLCEAGEVSSGANRCETEGGGVSKVRQPGGTLPSGVSAFTACGRTCDSFCASSSVEIPAWAASSFIV